MPPYTQILARTERPTQVLGSLKGLDVYVVPFTQVGHFVCERASEGDLRITIQLARGLSHALGRGAAVLAFAGNEGTGFGCALFEGGETRCEHNRLTGPKDFAEKPASPAEIEALCGSFGPDVDREAVREVLTGSPSRSAVDRHAALARLLGLPAWSPGIGYARAAEGTVPPEAGTPSRPPRSVRELLGAGALPETVKAPNSSVRFRKTCGRAFSFLEDLGFWKERGWQFKSLKPPGGEYRMCYRSRHLIVVIAGLSYGGRTGLYLMDQESRFLDLMGLVERRDPELLDLCRLAVDQSEQIPLFAEALRRCGADVVAGDLTAISPLSEAEPGSQTEYETVLELYGPQDRLSTLWAQIWRAARLYKIKASFRRRRPLSGPFVGQTRQG
jgi:hypothetical protein